jgi:hypothetical protein
VEGERGLVVGCGDVDHDQARFGQVHFVDRFHDRHDARTGTVFSFRFAFTLARA